MALIVCQDVSFAYEGRVVVSCLNFTVESGDYLCVVGENGSGKSTLIKGLLRLKAPQTGKIVFGDGLRPSEIGYLPQQTTAQKSFPASTYEVVLSGRLGARGVLPFYTRADKAIVEENLKRVDIGDLRDRCYGELSGGQQRRVLLARALCATKKVLLLDEPVAGLDPLIAKELYRIIGCLNREAGMTVIMVSHDIHSAVRYAKHVLHVKNTQAFFGETAEYQKTEAGIRFLEGGWDDGRAD